MTGSIIRADNSGLGNLARELYDNEIIHKVLIATNMVYRSFPERFPNSRIGVTRENIDWLLDGLDKLLIIETPFDNSLIQSAKDKGIKTIFMPMHEGLRENNDHNPDLWICPSLLDYELPIEPKVFLPVPVNTERVKWKLREKAKVFIHNAGHGGIRGRNGTIELLQAMEHVKSDIKLIIRSQSMEITTADPRIEVRYQNLKDYWDLWDEGDVFVFPEQFNGLSLPMQEAAAAGFMVMTSDRFPNNAWLPTEPLIPVEEEYPLKVVRRIKAARINPITLAAKIDEFAHQDISKFSKWGREWAKKHSWKALKEDYQCL